MAKAKPPTRTANPTSKERPLAKPAARSRRRTSAPTMPRPLSTRPRVDMLPGHSALQPVLRSIRSVIYKVDDLARAKVFYAAALARQPYFDQPFYVGFDIDGQELGLDPDTSSQRPGPGGAVAYWKVDDLASTWRRLTTELGGRPVEVPRSVGDGIETAVIADPFGNLLGLIQLAG
jgi:predicted enzyme related to lactoylglutathione lyase